MRENGPLLSRVVDPPGTKGGPRTGNFPSPPKNIFCPGWSHHSGQKGLLSRVVAPPGTKAPHITLILPLPLFPNHFTIFLISAGAPSSRCSIRRLLLAIVVVPERRRPLLLEDTPLELCRPTAPSSPSAVIADHCPRAGPDLALHPHAPPELTGPAPLSQTPPSTSTRRRPQRRLPPCRHPASSDLHRCRPELAGPDLDARRAAPRPRPPPCRRDLDRRRAAPLGRRLSSPTRCTTADAGRRPWT
ncbi:hypothetical protein PVAP13_6NG118203 [Panicum virgatum]|uniref:Uncharacterized protein n=1 Tax=Panicum virgatum TaxID=38727 RepID=A0A8T0R0F0_PANVG|nr:hypothetical protein PVAP13_6NG118203 [Panicum virgatum]